MEVDGPQREEINEALTHRIPPKNKYDQPTLIRMMGRIRDNLISIPSGREDLIPPDYEVKDKRVFSPVTFPID